ncbi:MAG: hypothetical protein SFW35_03230 [Chitinophagales bacterium]|nr:hypothetical protein [Chitinophagales bacterium]
MMKAILITIGIISFMTVAAQQKDVGSTENYSKPVFTSEERQVIKLQRSGQKGADNKDSVIFSDENAQKLSVATKPSNGRVARKNRAITKNKEKAAVKFEYN